VSGTLAPMTIVCACAVSGNASANPIAAMNVLADMTDAFLDLLGVIVMQELVTQDLCRRLRRRALPHPMWTAPGQSMSRMRSRPSLKRCSVNRNIVPISIRKKLPDPVKQTTAATTP
jgi:hypothetical protein